ncbi:GNAT family N-acetyltransferase [Alkalihalobacillus sp. AL-G]|uniref:GNAT family N-acetyltransferase n=1 Tax=Alkalihalobacillus sp. AL-G TaxID=2926399 RepID=UPI00272A0E56|nr:GNAT family N-acetyltransferase [Alkalihalobacillus sp. AL-G]WLD91935.1 GNAT family N-acetyltransferase [Alkalihalobacillus sp. AL-G]
MIEYKRWDEATVPVKDACKLWNEEFENAFPLTDRLFIQNSVQCPHVLSEGSYFVENDGESIGFIVSKVTRERTDLLPDQIGWIQALIVKREQRGKGIGTKLIHLAERALRANGVKKIVLGRDVHHYFPGIPSERLQSSGWFKKKGFRFVNTEKDYYRKAPETYYSSETDLDFSVLKEAEQGALLSFLNQSFPGRWEYEAWDYFRAGGGGSHFLVAKKGGNIIGFVRVNDSESPVLGPNVYWRPLFSEKLIGIGPLGINRQFRKKGYGKAIVDAAIQLAVERNAKHLVIDWTELDTFYRSFGFQEWRQYKQYEKDI